MVSEVITQVVDRPIELEPLAKTPQILDVCEDTFVLEEGIRLSDLLKSPKRKTLPPICWEDSTWRNPEDVILLGGKRQEAHAFFFLNLPKPFKILQIHSLANFMNKSTCDQSETLLNVIYASSLWITKQRAIKTIPFQSHFLSLSYNRRDYGGD